MASSPSLPTAASQQAVRKLLAFLKDSMEAACVSGKEPGSGHQGSQEPTRPCSQLAGVRPPQHLGFLLFKMSLALRRERDVYYLGAGLSVPADGYCDVETT